MVVFLFFDVWKILSLIVKSTTHMIIDIVRIKKRLTINRRLKFSIKLYEAVFYLLEIKGNLQWENHMSKRTAKLLHFNRIEFRGSCVRAIFPGI